MVSEEPVAPVPVIVPFTSVSVRIDTIAVGSGVANGRPAASSSAYDRVIVNPFVVTGAQSKRWLVAEYAQEDVPDDGTDAAAVTPGTEADKAVAEYVAMPPADI